MQLGGCAQLREALRLVVGLHWIGLLGTDGAAGSKGGEAPYQPAGLPNLQTIHAICTKRLKFFLPLSHSFV